MAVTALHMHALADASTREQQQHIMQLVGDALAKVHQRFESDPEKVAKLASRVPYI